MINIFMQDWACLTGRVCVCVCGCVCVFPLCVLVETVQGEKAGCGISKIISLPDGKTSHIPFEVPHVILCKGSVCVCVDGGCIYTHTLVIIGSRDTRAYANNSRNVTLIQ